MKFREFELKDKPDDDHINDDFRRHRVDPDSINPSQEIRSAWADQIVKDTRDLVAKKREEFPDFELTTKTLSILIKENPPVFLGFSIREVLKLFDSNINVFIKRVDSSVKKVKPTPAKETPKPVAPVLAIAKDKPKKATIPPRRVAVKRDSPEEPPREKWFIERREMIQKLLEPWIENKIRENPGFIFTAENLEEFLKAHPETFNYPLTINMVLRYFAQNDQDSQYNQIKSLNFKFNLPRSK